MRKVEYKIEEQITTIVALILCRMLYNKEFYNASNDITSSDRHYGTSALPCSETETYTYTTGKVKKYKDIGDYKNTFVNHGAGLFLGADHCIDPFKSKNDAVSADSLTISRGLSIYLGIDYYWHLFAI